MSYRVTVCYLNPVSQKVGYTYVYADCFDEGEAAREAKDKVKGEHPNCSVQVIRVTSKFNNVM